MEDTQKLKNYFQDIADNFDAFYSKEKSLILRILDSVLRRSMNQRFIVALSECRNLSGKEVLDVGCGSGRYSVSLAKEGGRVTGIDFSANMLKLALGLAKEYNVDTQCEFIQGDFLEYDFSKKFNISLAVGVFDYFKEPVPFLSKIRQIASEKAIFSFPKRWHIATPLRKIRLTLLGCPVTFYTAKQIQRLLSEAGFKKYVLKDLGRDYLVIADTTEESTGS